MKTVPCLLIAVLISTVGWLPAAPAAVMSVQIREGQVRASPSFLAKPVAGVAYGQQVEVMETRGDWSRVRAGAHSGWIHTTSLSRKKLTLRAGDEEVSSTASNKEIALAGKGFTEDLEAQYRNQHPASEFKEVDRMEKIKFDPEALLRFLREGGVEPKAGGAR